MQKSKAKFFPRYTENDIFGKFFAKIKKENAENQKRKSEITTPPCYACMWAYRSTAVCVMVVGGGEDDDIYRIYRVAMCAHTKHIINIYILQVYYNSLHESTCGGAGGSGISLPINYQQPTHTDYTRGIDVRNVNFPGETDYPLSPFFKNKENR